VSINADNLSEITKRCNTATAECSPAAGSSGSALLGARWEALPALGASGEGEGQHSRACAVKR